MTGVTLIVCIILGVLYDGCEKGNDAGCYDAINNTVCQLSTGLCVCKLGWYGDFVDNSTCIKRKCSKIYRLQIIKLWLISHNDLRYNTVGHV